MPSRRGNRGAEAVRYTIASSVILGLDLALGFRPDAGYLGVLAGTPCC